MSWDVNDISLNSNTSRTWALTALSYDIVHHRFTSTDSLYAYLRLCEPQAQYTRGRYSKALSVDCPERIDGKLFGVYEDVLLVPTTDGAPECMT